jgi:hypothetical protein
VVRANGGSSITMARNAGAGDDDDLYCQFVSKSALINPLNDSDVTCVDFDLAVCPYGDDAATIKTPAPSPISTSSPTPRSTSRNNSTEISSAVDTKRFGAALALMAVSISFFALL